MLLAVKKDKGWDIPIHVDGASGGFVAPFTDPKFKWEFRLEQVKSINVSGHKYGLVYPSIGWIVWRDESDFPKDLEFKVNYLGGWMPTYTLNFSRSSIGILGQYCNFLRLGMEGYTNIMNNCLQNAQYLTSLIEKSEYFEMINLSQMLPIVAMRLKDTVKNFTVFDLSSKLRERGWVMAAYTLPPNAETVAILRVVVREHFSHDMAEILFKDIMNACKALGEGTRQPKEVKSDEKHRPIC